MPLTILVAPSGFKEGLDVGDVADAITRGVRRALPSSKIITVPVFDGGEGFARTLARLLGDTMRKVTVSGPLGSPVRASYAMMSLNGRRTAAIEISAAAGLRLVPAHRRNLLHTTSQGVGEMIRAALDAKAERILVGCGDSGVNDGGVGMAKALGVRFLNRHTKEIPPGGAALASLHRIDMSRLDPRLRCVEIQVCVNIRNMLLGRYGVSRIFGPQKGATAAHVCELEKALKRYALCIRQATGIDTAAVPGGGASGGLGAGLHALLGAQLIARYDFISQFIPLTNHIDKAHLIITAEGRIDGQTCRGKIPGEIGRHAKEKGKPVIVLAGSIGRGAEDCYAHGISAFISIIDQPYRLDDAVSRTRILLEQCAESLMRIVSFAQMLPSGSSSCRVPPRFKITDIVQSRTR